MPITRTSLLVRLRADSDPTGWHEFVRMYGPLLRCFARRAGIPDQDAGDVVQDILLRLLRALPEFEYSPERGRFRAWLRSICRNTVIDWRRRQVQRRERAICEEPLAASEAADDCWNAEHRRYVVRHALAAVRTQVSLSAWNCFEQYVLQERPAADVARELQLSPAAVYVIASRVRARLRRKCAQFDEDLE